MAKLKDKFGKEYLLPPMSEENNGKKTLVLDLDRTLVYSSETPVDKADFSISYQCWGSVEEVHVRKRPGVDEFLQTVSKHFEVVLFTSGTPEYGTALLDILDPEGFLHFRLFRDSQSMGIGGGVKDLSRLGRDLAKTVIVEDEPARFCRQPKNGIHIEPWCGNPQDTALYELVHFLDLVKHADDVRDVLAKHPFMNRRGIDFFTR